MQHLNLYSQLERFKEPPLSARQQLWIVASVTVVMLLIFGFLQFSKISKQNELAALTQQQVALSNSLNELKAKKAKLEQDNTLENEIARLQSDVIFRRKLLASIDPNNTVLETGFVDHLESLARQHIDGMWFTEIQLQGGGQQLALIGQTRAPEYVPRYLQKLSGEAVFEGHQFRVFRMSVPAEQKHLLNFELRAHEVGLQ